MPIIQIRALEPLDTDAIPRMIANVRNQAAAALKGSVSNIWVIFDAFRPERYEHPNQSTVIVTIKALAGRSREIQTAFVMAVAIAIGEGLSVSPAHVWIHYEEMQPQNVWFQGGWTKLD